MIIFIILCYIDCIQFVWIYSADIHVILIHQMSESYNWVQQAIVNTNYFEQ